MDLAHDRIGTGPPLVLLHGIGDRRQTWAPVLDRLAPVREVIPVDLPGFGASPPLPAGDPPTVRRLADAVSGLLDALGLEDVHVAGNSLGGGIALELARRGRVRSATAISPIGFWTPKELAFTRVSLRNGRLAAKAVAPVAGVALRPALVRVLSLGQYLARPWRMPPDVAAAGMRHLATCPGFEVTLDAAVTGRFERPEELRGAAVTVAWGDRDRLLLPRQAPRAERLLPWGRHVRLPGCGHVPMWDDPERVAAVLLDGSTVPAA